MMKKYEVSEGPIGLWNCVVPFHGTRQLLSFYLLAIDWLRHMCSLQQFLSLIVVVITITVIMGPLCNSLPLEGCGIAPVLWALFTGESQPTTPRVRKVAAGSGFLFVVVQHYIQERVPFKITWGCSMNFTLHLAFQ
ncbi:hypothetical protein Pelo_4840 [Pelomyxa schiedti]|nr:hypothetical protein Pelo_4840 [Pelomyxa schiedti]